MNQSPWTKPLLIAEIAAATTSVVLGIILFYNSVVAAIAVIALGAVFGVVAGVLSEHIGRKTNRPAVALAAATGGGVLSAILACLAVWFAFVFYYLLTGSF